MLKKKMEEDVHIDLAPKPHVVVPHDYGDFVQGILTVFTVMCVVSLIPLCFFSRLAAISAAVTAVASWALAWSIEPGQEWLAGKICPTPAWDTSLSFRVGARSWVGGASISNADFRFRADSLPIDIAEKFKHLEPVSISINTSVTTFPFRRLYTYEIKIGKAELYATDVGALPPSVIYFLGYMTKEMHLILEYAQSNYADVAAEQFAALKEDMVAFDLAMETLTHRVSQQAIGESV